MPVKIELPEDVIHDLEQEAARRHLSPAEIIREALSMWRVRREIPVNDREQIMQVLRDRGLLCTLPTEFSAQAQPPTEEELDRLAAQAAQAGPLSDLIIQERRGESEWRCTSLILALS